MKYYIKYWEEKTPASYAFIHLNMKQEYGLSYEDFEEYYSLKICRFLLKTFIYHYPKLFFYKIISK